MRYDLDRDTEESCADMVPVDGGRYVESVDFDRVTAERDALQLLLNDLEEQNHSLEQRRHAEKQAGQAAERRVAELEWVLMAIRSKSIDTILIAQIDAALNPTAEAVSNEA
ncbi:hypothetical protein M3M50_10585 [Pseudomonas bijieensis]|uniref:hypothetical protein n=1 Tax=Pseudomonas bijieensis TaxID=2681983 RepID=UPI00200C64A3|nr:hypothetical protein [Pseudomonas bijieensis]UQI33046.1 hypothetical protein M3M50_10585 [Pseudomonas bijieensis]